MFLVIRKPQDDRFANCDDIIALCPMLAEAKEDALNYLSDYYEDKTMVIYRLERIGEFVLKPQELVEV